MKKIYFALLIFISTSVYCQQIISSNTTWATNQVLTQSVIIQQGVTLTVNPGVNVQVLFIDNNTDLIGDVKIEVKGTINVLGTACNKVNFIPYVATTNKQYWSGIELDTLAINCSIVNATIQNANFGIKIENTSATINGVEILNSKVNGIYAFGSNTNLSVNNSSIRSCDGEGLLITDAAVFNINNTKIKLNGASGLNIVSVQNATIENSVIYNNGKTGVYLKSSSANISNTVIRKNVRMGMTLSNATLTCNKMDIDSNSIDGIFVGGSSILTMTNSSISDNLGFGIETSEYIFDIDFGNIIKTTFNPSINVNSSNFIGNQNTTAVISTNSIVGSGSYPFATGQTYITTACGNAASFCGGNGSGNPQLLPFLKDCWGMQTPSATYNWINLFSIEVPFGRLEGFSGSVGRRNYFPGPAAGDSRPKYGMFEEGTSVPFWEYVTPVMPNAVATSCEFIEANTLINNDRIVLSTALEGLCNNTTFAGCSGNSTLGYRIESFNFTVGGFNYRSLINSTAVTDILTGNYWDTIVPTAVTNSVGAVLNLNGFVINEIVTSHSDLSTSFVYSNASTFQLGQSAAQFCTSGNNFLIAPAGNYTYQWFNSGTLINNNNDSLLVTSNGNYSVLISGSCSATSSSTIVTLSTGSPVVITSNGPLNFCSGNNVTLSSPSATGNVWSNGATSQSIVVNTSGSFSLNVANATGCPSTSQTIQVTVTPLPAAPVISSSGNTTFCGNGSVTLSSNLNGNIIWTNSQTTQSIVVNSSGVYSAQIITNGCTSIPSNSIQVTVTPNPINLVTSSGPTTICQGNSVTLNAVTSAGNSYQWYKNNTIIPGATNSSFIANTAGNYNVFITNSTCSSTSAVTSVSVNQIPTSPTISANGNTTFCQGNNVTLNSNLSNIIWSNGATTQSITVSQSGSYTAQSSSNGCLSPVSNLITVSVNSVPSIPLISSSGPTTFCGGGNVTLTSSNNSNNLWSTNSNSQSIVVSNAGSYSVTVTNASGCSSTSQPVTVTVNPIPNAPIISSDGPTTFCSGNSVNLSSNTPNGNIWSTSNSSQTINVISAGSYSATVTENGCTSPSSNTINITVNPIPNAPTIIASGPTTFCSGQSVILTSSSSNGNFWSTGETTQSISISNTGIYSVQVTSNSCSNSSAPITITVNPTPNAPTIIANGSTTFCQGSNVTLTTDASSGVIWTISNGNQFPVATLIVQSNQSNIYATVTSNGCTSSPSLSISTTVLPIVNPSFSQLSAACAGGNINLPSTSNNGISGTWSPAINNTATTTYTFTPTAGQCGNTQTMTVTVNPLPTVSLATFNSICDTAGIVNLTGGTPAGGTYSGTSVSNNAFNTSIGVGTYPITYSYTNNNNCSSSSLNDLTVIECSNVGLSEEKAGNFLLYPNPANDNLILESSNDLLGKEYKIFDFSGRIILTGKINTLTKKIEITNISNGSYLFQIENESTNSIKFVKL
jgi:phosphohistidine swiveling domain-containing protein